MLFNDITPEELKVWEETFTKLIKISLWNTGGTQFLSKNPPHTGRVRELVKMFPNAKFIYLMRNPYTVFESTRSFFTNTIQPLKLEEFSDEQIEKNILTVYERLYHKYEADKACIPEGNLIEVRFEDFEADALGMTKKIYDTLSLPGWEEARTAIEQYVGAKKGYKKTNTTMHSARATSWKRTGNLRSTTGAIIVNRFLTKLAGTKCCNASIDTHLPSCFEISRCSKLKY